MATNHSTTSPAGNASPLLYEDRKNNDIVTLPAMARHAQRDLVLRLIARLQADRPASARVIACDFAPTDGGEAAR